MNLTANNYTDSVLAALVISIKAEMAEMYKEQLHALAKLNQEVDMVGRTRQRVQTQANNQNKQNGFMP